ncbi:MAG: hypothetical protein Q9227_004229 [Pyrenula ochraceoflavens]
MALALEIQNLQAAIQFQRDEISSGFDSLPASILASLLEGLQSAEAEYARLSSDHERQIRQSTSAENNIRPEESASNSDDKNPKYAFGANVLEPKAGDMKTSKEKAPCEQPITVGRQNGTEMPEKGKHPEGMIATDRPEQSNTASPIVRENFNDTSKTRLDAPAARSYNWMALTRTLGRLLTIVMGGKHNITGERNNILLDQLISSLTRSKKSMTRIQLKSRHLSKLQMWRRSPLKCQGQPMGPAIFVTKK